MKELTDKQIEEWTKIRERGMWRFVLLRGALMWGLFVAVPILIGLHVMGGVPGLLFVVVCCLSLSVVGGVLGYWEWHQMEVRLEHRTKN